MASSVKPPSKLYQKLIPIFANPTGLAIDRWLMRTFDFSFMGRMFMRAGGFPVRPHLILKTVHWKTGELKEAVLPYMKDGDNWIVVGSHGGRPTDPIWALNVRQHPQVWVCSDKRWTFCDARVAQDKDRARAWSIVNADNGYDGYTKMARKHRQLPVVVLSPASESVRPQEDKPTAV